MTINPLEHTFVICAYGENRYLEECVNSLMNQSIFSKAIIVTSTPNKTIKDIADKYELPLFINEGGKGIAADWNYATSIVDTKFYTLCHQDDIYERDYLKYVLKNIDDETIIAHSKGSYLYTSKEKRYSTNLIIKNIMNFPLIFFKRSIGMRRAILSIADTICCPSVTFNKKFCVNQFDSSFRQNLDWDCWERLSRLKGKFVYIPKYLMKHRITDSSTTAGNIKDSSRTKEDLIIYRRFHSEPVAKFLATILKYGEKDNYDR